MAEQLTPDLCVIGAGSGGLSVAAAAAALGVPVVLIEKAKMGGDCLNAGCVPSKALIAAAKRAEAIRSSAPFGIKPQRAGVEFYQVNDHIHEVIAAIAPNNSKERFTGLGVRVIEGEARFTDAKTVAVGDRFEIKARRFVIATGSRPAVPPIPGLDKTPYLTNETVFEMRRAAQASHRDRRRRDRARARAGVPPARLGRHRARGGGAARQARTRSAPRSCSMRSRARA